MKRQFAAIIVLLAALLVFPLSAAAQAEDSALQLGLTKNFGYGGLGKIQGDFSLKVVNPPQDLDLVEFYLDGELVFTAEEAPFLYKFHTSQFSDGEHTLSAVGYLDDGKKLGSNRVQKEFISSQQAWGETQQLIGPILIGTALLTILGVGLPVLFNRNKEFVLGKYGPAGGAVCPRCQLPFSRPVMAPNLVAGKLVRCLHCGKLAILPRAAPARLAEAEARFLADAKPGTLPAGADDLERQIAESRFEDDL